MLNIQNAARMGYDAERQKIIGQIAEHQRQLNGRPGRGSIPLSDTPGRSGGSTWSQIGTTL